MKVLLCVPGGQREYGGPIVAVEKIGSTLEKMGAVVSYLTSYSGAQKWWAELNNNTRRPCDVIATFGVWTLFNHYVARRAFQSGIPLVSCPIGMLEPWSLRQKRLKKIIAWYGYQKRDLQFSNALQATAYSEAINLTALGLRAPIKIIPHGVDLPDVRELKRLRRQFQEGGMRTALFLSRIHPKKGVVELVEAWNRVKPSGWKLVIVGPDSDGYSAKVTECISHCEGVTVELRGPVIEKEKSALLVSADLFLLPTYNENFGLVVAEALAHGLPVITTTGAPWSELPKFGCGWWVEPGIEPLAAVLREALTMEVDTLRLMGVRGRRFVEENYSWRVAAQQHIHLYRWAAFREGDPGFFCGAKAGTPDLGGKRPLRCYRETVERSIKSRSTGGQFN